MAPKKKRHNAEEILECQFWHAVRSDETKIIKITINQLLFCKFLYNEGFRRFDIEDDSIFIRIIDNRIIKPVTITEIQDFVFSWLNNLPINVDGEGLTPDQITEKVLKGVGFYFNKQKLNYLKPQRGELEFNRDTIDSKFVYYQNGFILVTAKDVKFKPYSKLVGYIWYSQVLQRDFKIDQIHKGRDVVNDFIGFIAGKGYRRALDLKIAVGYFLHDFTQYKLKALLLTDSGTGENGEANGRTGKTLFCHLIGYMVSSNPFDTRFKTYVEINGKDFDPRDKYKYSKCSVDTKLIILNDLKRGFDVDLIYNDITEGVLVDKKNMQPFNITPKIILTTNKTIELEGASSYDRFIEFELSEFFSDTHTPDVEFKQWFFRDWEKSNWNAYDKAMINCIQLFFKNDSKLNKPTQINLNERKLKDNTAPEFMEFIREVWKPRLNTPYDKTFEYNDFKEHFPDFDNQKFTQRKFSAWIKKFCDYTDMIDNFKKDTHEQRTSQGTFYIFYSKGDKDNKLIK
ncbi:MAG: hypothetical protein ACUZ8H_16390 [Candidatus Anammoxibacter sp.]